MIVKDSSQNLAVGRNIDRGIEDPGAGRIVADRNGRRPSVPAVHRFRENNSRVSGENGLIHDENISMSRINDSRREERTGANRGFVVFGGMRRDQLRAPKSHTPVRRNDSLEMFARVRVGSEAPINDHQISIWKKDRLRTLGVACGRTN